MKKVLGDPQYGFHPRQLMLEIERTDGVVNAADLIEQVLHEQRPVLRAAAVPV